MHVQHARDMCAGEALNTLRGTKLVFGKTKVARYPVGEGVQYPRHTYLRMGIFTLLAAVAPASSVAAAIKVRPNMLEPELRGGFSVQFCRAGVAAGGQLPHRPSDWRSRRTQTK